MSTNVQKRQRTNKSTLRQSRPPSGHPNALNRQSTTPKENQQDPPTITSEKETLNKTISTERHNQWRQETTIHCKATFHPEQSLE